MQISTHTPAWGVTVYNMSYTSTEVNFNSHARVGRDAEDLAQFKVVGLISTHTPAWGVTIDDGGIRSAVSISTHTPAWGVTHPDSPLSQHSGNFNSHARVGRDPNPPKTKSTCLQFQLTRPRGA